MNLLGAVRERANRVVAAVVIAISHTDLWGDYGVCHLAATSRGVASDQ